MKNRAASGRKLGIALIPALIFFQYEANERFYVYAHGKGISTIIVVSENLSVGSRQ